MFAGNIARVNRLVAAVEANTIGGIHLVDGRAVGVMKSSTVGVADIT